MLSTDAGQTSTLARAAEATAKLKEEIDQMWSDSVSTDESVVSERLAAVSHAIRRVSHLFDEARVIG
jgi:hypothetical protein